MAARSYDDEVVGPVILLTVIVVVLSAAVLARVRAAVLPRSPIVQYTPVTGASVIDDAILAGRERRAIAAGLIDLVVRGRVRLLTEQGASRESMAVQIVDAENLSDDDLRLLEVVCGPDTPSGYSRRLSRDRRKTARLARTLVEARARRLRRAGLWNGHFLGRAFIRWGGALVLAVVVAFLTTGPAPAVFGVALSAVAVLAAALVIVPSGRRRRFAPAARERREHLDGIRQYLRVAEERRVRALQSPTGSLADVDDRVSLFALHERLLPYAVIFGVEKEWLGLLQLGYDEMGQTSQHAMTTVGDAFLQVADAGALVNGLVNIVFAADHAVDAVGAVFDGLF